jgi:SSS family solute:Na+ symporter
VPTQSYGQIVAIVVVSMLIFAAGAGLSVHFGRRARDARDWLAAPESLPLSVVVITQFATAVGGGVLIAHVGIAYASGWSVFAYEACILLGFAALALIAPWLHQQGFTTVPDIIARLFGRSRAATAVAGIATLIVPFGALTTQFVAFAKLFGGLTGISPTILTVVIALGSLAFVLPGGLTSVVWTDFVFGIFKIVMSLVVAGIAIYLAGGWFGISSRVPEDLWQPRGFFAAGEEQIWLWVAAIVPGTLTNQLYYQRVFATRNVRDARRGLVLSGLTIVIAGVYAGCIGLAVRAMNPDLEPEQAAGWLITILPTPVLVLFGAFLVATIVSVTGACLQSVVANMTRDLYQGVLGGGRDDRGMISLSRLLSVVVAALASVLAVVFPSALAWLVASYAYSAAALAAPIFVGYALRRRGIVRPAAALASMVAGIVGCAVAQAVGTTVPYAMYGIAASTLVLLVLGIRRRTPQETAPDISIAESRGEA